MRVHNILMGLIGLVVVWSLLGISVQQSGGKTEYSLFIKTQPSAQLLYSSSI